MAKKQSGGEPNRSEFIREVFAPESAGKTCRRARGMAGRRHSGKITHTLFYKARLRKSRKSKSARRQHQKAKPVVAPKGSARPAIISPSNGPLIGWWNRPTSLGSRSVRCHPGGSPPRVGKADFRLGGQPLDCGWLTLDVVVVHVETNRTADHLENTGRFGLLIVAVFVVLTPPAWFLVAFGFLAWVHRRHWRRNTVVVQNAGMIFQLLIRYVVCIVAARWRKE